MNRKSLLAAVLLVAAASWPAEAFDPYQTEEMTPEMERYYMAPQWRLICWKFKRHKLAVVAG